MRREEERGGNGNSTIKQASKVDVVSSKWFAADADSDGGKKAIGGD